MKRFALVGAVVVAAGLVVGTGASPAFADSTTLTSPVKAGSNAVTVGSAAFTRTQQSDGSALITLHGSIPKGITESSLCWSTKAYTSRVSPGQCPLSQGNTGTAVDYTLVVPAAQAKGTLHFQFHVTTGPDTAFAGWHSGNPFYGTVALAAPAPPTSVPVGTFGGLGVAVLAGIALLWTTRRARPTTLAELGQISRH